MHFGDDELRKTISRLTDEQLVRMMGVESGDYRKEALEFAEAEIKTRGISLSELADAASAPTQDEQNHLSTGANLPTLNSASPFDRLRARSLPIWLFLSILIFVPLTIWVIRGTPLAENGKILFSAEFHFLVAVWICWQCLRCDINSEQLLGPTPNKLQIWALVALAFPLIVLSVGSSWLTLWLRYFLFLLFDTNFVSSWLTPSPKFVYRFEFWTVVQVFLTTIYGPIIEEIVFRGLILHRWAQKWGMNRALLATSLAFALCHKEPIGTFVFGLAMAILYLHTRSLVIPIVCHAFFNALALTTQAIEGMRHWWNGPLCLILVIPAVLVFLHRSWPDREASLPYFDTARIADASAVQV